MLKSERLEEIPVPHTEIERLVQNATLEINKDEPVGFYNQSLENIANATFMKRGGDFWLIWDDETKKAYGYALCSISKDIDNRLTYWGTQAYADPEIRHTRIITDLWKKVEDYARQHLCKHFVIISSRETRAYQKLLGNEWHEYATLLKKEL